MGNTPLFYRLFYIGNKGEENHIIHVQSAAQLGQIRLEWPIRTRETEILETLRRINHSEQTREPKMTP